MEKHFGTGIETRSRCSLENKLLMLWCNLFTTSLWYISNISAFVVKERKKTERTKKKSLFFAACKSHPPLKKKRKLLFFSFNFFPHEHSFGFFPILQHAKGISSNCKYFYYSFNIFLKIKYFLFPSFFFSIDLKKNPTAENVFEPLKMFFTVSVIWEKEREKKEEIIKINDKVPRINS